MALILKVIVLGILLQLPRMHRNLESEESPSNFWSAYNVWSPLQPVDLPKRHPLFLITITFVWYYLDSKNVNKSQRLFSVQNIPFLALLDRHILDQNTAKRPVQLHEQPPCCTLNKKITHNTLLNSAGRRRGY